MLKWLFSAASPAGPEARLSILIFHRVLPQPDPMQPGELDADGFDRLCGWVRRWFNVLPLETAVRLCGQGGLPARALCITFDDGYADNHAVAMPILLRHGLNATFFVSTAFLGRGIMWNDRVIEALRGSPLQAFDGREFGLPGLLSLGRWPERAAAAQALLKGIKHLPAPDREAAVARVERSAGARPATGLMMTADEVRALAAAGMHIGAHTHTHPILATLDAPAAEQEIRLGKDRLEQLLDRPVTLFAYPNGKPVQDFGPEHVQMARRAGFAAAVTTAPGVASRLADPFQLPRFTPWDRTRLRFGMRMGANLLRTAA